MLGIKRLLGVTKEVAIFAAAGPWYYAAYRLFALGRKKRKEGQKNTYDVDCTAMFCLGAGGLGYDAVFTCYAYWRAYKFLKAFVQDKLKARKETKPRKATGLGSLQPRINYRIQRSKAAALEPAHDVIEIAAPRASAQDTDRDIDEIDAALAAGGAEGEAAAGEGQSMGFLNMLQQYGFKLVVPEGGGNQVILMPPGAEDEEGEGAMGDDEDHGGYMDAGPGGMYVPGGAGAGGMVLRQGPDGQMYMMQMGGDDEDDDMYDDEEGGMYIEGDEEGMFDEDEDPEDM